MIVGSLGANLPFVDRATSAFGFDAVLSGQMFGKQTMLFGAGAEQREATPIAHRDSEA